MSNPFKHSLRANKRDSVTPLHSDYYFIVNDSELSKSFPTKVEMLRSLQNYRETHNEIHQLDMFKIVTYQLNS